MMPDNDIKPDKTLDVRGDVCPRPMLLTMVTLRKLETGQVLRVLGDYAPSLRNIRRDAMDEGHTILKTAAMGEAEWEIIIRKEA